MKSIIEKMAKFNSKHRKNEASVTLTCSPTRPEGEWKSVLDSIYLDLKNDSRTEPNMELISLRLQTDGSFPEITLNEVFAIPDMEILIDFFQLAKEINDTLEGNENES